MWPPRDALGCQLRWAFGAAGLLLTRFRTAGHRTRPSESTRRILLVIFRCPSSQMSLVGAPVFRLVALCHSPTFRRRTARTPVGATWHGQRVVRPEAAHWRTWGHSAWPDRRSDTRKAQRGRPQVTPGDQRQPPTTNGCLRRNRGGARAVHKGQRRTSRIAESSGSCLRGLWVRFPRGPHSPRSSA